MSILPRLTIAPHCPIANCNGAFRYSHAIAQNAYSKCAICGELSAGRKMTSAEKAQQKAAKAAKRSKKTAAQIKEEQRQADRQRALNVKQLPVEGWTPADWFPGLAE